MKYCLETPFCILAVVILGLAIPGGTVTSDNTFGNVPPFEWLPSDWSPAMVNPINEVYKFEPTAEIEVPSFGAKTLHPDLPQEVPNPYAGIPFSESPRICHIAADGYGLDQPPANPVTTTESPPANQKTAPAKNLNVIPAETGTGTSFPVIGSFAIFENPGLDYPKIVLPGARHIIPF